LRRRPRPKLGCGAKERRYYTLYYIITIFSGKNAFSYVVNCKSHIPEAFFCFCRFLMQQKHIPALLCGVKEADYVFIFRSLLGRNNEHF
jgi:hypothetical protein